MQFSMFACAKRIYTGIAFGVCLAYASKYDVLGGGLVKLFVNGLNI